MPFFSSRIHGQGRVEEPARLHTFCVRCLPRETVCSSRAPLCFCARRTCPPTPTPPVNPVHRHLQMHRNRSQGSGKKKRHEDRTKRDGRELGRCRRGAEHREGRGQGRWYREYILQYVELSSPQRSHSGKGRTRRAPSCLPSSAERMTVKLKNWISKTSRRFYDRPVWATNRTLPSRHGRGHQPG